VSVPLETDLVSPAVFAWLMTVMVIGISGSWIVVDIVRLRRALRDRDRLGSVRDRVFGSIIGMVIGAIGVVGGFLHHLG
jgi:hypothetical protein